VGRVGSAQLSDDALGKGLQQGMGWGGCLSRWGLVEVCGCASGDSTSADDTQHMAC
jgi:hypothetical protein